MRRGQIKQDTHICINGCDSSDSELAGVCQPAGRCTAVIRYEVHGQCERLHSSCNQPPAGGMLAAKLQYDTCRQWLKMESQRLARNITQTNIKSKQKKNISEASKKLKPPTKFFQKSSADPALNPCYQASVFRGAGSANVFIAARAGTTPGRPSFIKTAREKRTGQAMRKKSFAPHGSPDQGRLAQLASQVPCQPAAEMQEGGPVRPRVDVPPGRALIEARRASASGTAPRLATTQPTSDHHQE